MKRLAVLLISVLFAAACSHQETPASGSMGTNSGYGGTSDAAPLPGRISNTSPDWVNGPGVYGPNDTVATGTQEGAAPATPNRPHHKPIP